MKLLLYRFSLTEAKQLDLIDRPPQSRESFLMEWFSKPLSFKSHGDTEMKYHPTQEDKTIIAGCFAKCSSTLIDCDPSNPFAQEDGIHWEKAAFFLNVGNDEQVIAVEYNNRVGKPSSLLNGLTSHLNKITSRNAYILSFHSINNEGEFWDAINLHHSKEGKITLIEFDMIVPNPPDIESPTKDGLNRLKERLNAEKVKETISNPNGLHLDNDEVKNRESYIQVGGGDITAKDGKTVVYNSKNKQRRIEIDDELYPDGEEKVGIFRRLAGLLKR